MKIEDYINEAIEYQEENADEVSLSKICEEVKNKFNTKCTHQYIGGFDSPGYDIDCYAIAFIDEDGNVEIVPYNKERY